MRLRKLSFLLLVELASDLPAGLDLWLFFPFFKNSVNLLVLEGRAFPILLPSCAGIGISPAMAAHIHGASVAGSDWFS